MKVALCFSGQARSYKKGYPYYEHNLLSKQDVDVYIHTWASRDDEETQEIYKELSSLYKPKNIIIQSPVSGEFIDNIYTNNPNPQRHPPRFTYSMLMSMYLCSKLLEESGEKYDWVIKSRTDYALNGVIPFEMMDNSKLYIPNCRMVPTKDFGNDQFAFSSQENMMKYMTTFNHIDEYYNAGNQFIGEDMMRANLHKHGLFGDKLEYVDMHNPFPPGPQNATWHSLIRDDYQEWTK